MNKAWATTLMVFSFVLTAFLCLVYLFSMDEDGSYLESSHGNSMLFAGNVVDIESQVLGEASLGIAPGLERADLNKDGIISLNDYSILLDAYKGFATSNGVSYRKYSYCDLNNDGTIGIGDFINWLDAYRSYIGNNTISIKTTADGNGSVVTAGTVVNFEAYLTDEADSIISWQIMESVPDKSNESIVVYIEGGAGPMQKVTAVNNGKATIRAIARSGLFIDKTITVSDSPVSFENPSGDLTVCVDCSYTLKVKLLEANDSVTSWQILESNPASGVADDPVIYMTGNVSQAKSTEQVIKGISNGTVKVKVTTKNYPRGIVSPLITVNDARLSINPSISSILVGGEVTLNSVYLQTNDYVTECTSSDEAIATATLIEENNSCRIFGIKSGSVTVSIKTKESYTATSTVTVVESHYAYITAEAANGTQMSSVSTDINNPSIVVLQAENAEITLTARGVDGSPVAAESWSITEVGDSTGVIYMNCKPGPTQTVVPLKNGTVTVTATFADHEEDPATIVIRVTSITLSPKIDPSYGAVPICKGEVKDITATLPTAEETVVSWYISRPVISSGQTGETPIVYISGAPDNSVSVLGLNVGSAELTLVTSNNNTSSIDIYVTEDTSHCASGSYE